MPARRDRSDKPDSDENRRADQNHGRSSPEYPYEADENLQKSYQGYDEERSSFDPRDEDDFDVDENDFNDRKEEYKKVKRDIVGPESENTRHDDVDRRGTK